MERVYYTVSVDQNGAWGIEVGEETSRRFDHQHEAVRAAASAARDLWERHGRASGVRVLCADGKWEEPHSFGTHAARGLDAGSD